MSIVPDCHKIAVVAITTRMNAARSRWCYPLNCRDLVGRTWQASPFCRDDHRSCVWKQLDGPKKAALRQWAAIRYSANGASPRLFRPWERVERPIHRPFRDRGSLWRGPRSPTFLTVRGPTGTRWRALRGCSGGHSRTLPRPPATCSRVGQKLGRVLRRADSDHLPPKRRYISIRPSESRTDQANAPTSCSA